MTSSLLVPDAAIPGITIVRLGRREDTLATSQKAVTIRRVLATQWPALQVAAQLEHGEDHSEASPWSLGSDNGRLSLPPAVAFALLAWRHHVHPTVVATCGPTAVSVGLRGNRPSRAGAGVSPATSMGPP